MHSATISGRTLLRLASVGALLLAVLASIVGPTPRGALALSINPAVVISQVYGGGGNTGAPLTNDFVELFNRSASTASLSGLSLQYASATGTGNFGANPVVALSGSLAPGQSYLVQLAGGANGVALPTPDATGTINASGTAGKFALVNGTTGLACNGGSTPCSQAQIDQIIDLVGYGGANFFEGAGAAPTLSATTAGIRAGNGCTDTNNNSADFSAGTPAPRNTGAALAPCGPVAQPIVATATPPAITTPAGTAASSALSATDADSIVNGASISGAVAGITLDGFTAATAEGGTATATLNVAASTAAGSYSLVVTFSNDDGQTAELAVPVTVEAAAPTITRIHQIQGSGPSVTGPGPFTVEAIVTGDFQTQGSGQLRGFFLQEQDADADADPATSEGIFVFCATCPVDVAVGDLVRVTGPASDFFGMSQLSPDPVAAGSVVVLSAGNPLPTPAAPSLPVPGVPAGDLTAARAAINAYFEQFEGMLVRFASQLAVAEYFELARYGQVILAAGDRPRQFTDLSLPSVAGFTDHQIDFAARTIILDDDNNVQNDAVTGVDTPYYHPVPGLSVGNYFRGGDTIDGLTGVLHWSFAGQAGTDAWRIRPVPDRFSYAFTRANERPAPPQLAGSLKVAAYNVLNYFLTVDTTASNNLGTCGPDLTADCRGADSARELERQREKLTQALLGLDADIVGLIEMENTPGVNPTLAMVNDLNAIEGPGTYAFIDTGVIGTDAIRVGLLYQPGAVTPVGNFAILDSSVDPDFDSSRSRPALAQSFRENATGAVFTVVVNHFKSKGDSGLGGASGICTTQGPGADPNCDKGDGQSFWNDSRTRAAEALARWLATDPTDSGDPDVMIVGDLNAYRNEDPVRALEAAGYTDLIDSAMGAAAYSFLFSGQLGYLDHALASPSLTGQVVDVDEWHINADEIPLFDYNDEIRDPGEAAFERESTATDIYEPDAFRTSDHDPVIVGLNLDGVAPTTTASVSGPQNPLCPADCFQGSATVTLTASDTQAGVTETRYRVNGGEFQVYSGPFAVSTLGANLVEFFSTDGAGNVEATQSVVVKVSDFPATGVLDAFNRADGRLGNSWQGATQRDQYAISGGAVTVGSGGLALWRPTVFGANQEAFMRLTALNATSVHHTLALKVRGSNGAGGAILVSYDAAGQQITVEAGVPGQGFRTVAAYPATAQAGALLGARALSDGTVLVYLDCALIGTADTKTVAGNTYVGQGGRIGVWFLSAAGAAFDDFGGGNLP